MNWLKSLFSKSKGSVKNLKELKPSRFPVFDMFFRCAIDRLKESALLCITREDRFGVYVLSDFIVNEVEVVKLVPEKFPINRGFLSSESDFEIHILFDFACNNLSCGEAYLVGFAIYRGMLRLVLFGLKDFIREEEFGVKIYDYASASFLIRGDWINEFKRIFHFGGMFVTKKNPYFIAVVRPNVDSRSVQAVLVDIKRLKVRGVPC